MKGDINKQQQRQQRQRKQQQQQQQQTIEEGVGNLPDTFGVFTQLLDVVN